MDLSIYFDTPQAGAKILSHTVSGPKTQPPEKKRPGPHLIPEA